MRFGVVVFPGSNCEHDCYYMLKYILQQSVRFVWHKERDLSEFDAVILPGGFSYGDYLRTGAIARFSPVMEEVNKFARAGGIVVGICNGFQILCEAGLLPGALVRNAGVRFVAKSVYLKVENTDTLFTRRCTDHVLKMPLAHGDGNYYADAETLQRLREQNRILFRYCTPGGEITAAANPNGALDNIAGIMNEAGNVMGLMPHPERACEKVLGSNHGLQIFQSLVA
ncbi:MAG: phosphoribosylformylglycinamidine synthase subunit PurQ [candidate division KSB1 bacterium]|nr:phosphoribosylformylglycinamidine synthase subunit PurQ [candidate division KSB1 bacterium]MDZ7366511.1 phosphoribosylformylglycinamidine synthase subunit PurQ [candidate division KSB1 bacterium]MDZ7404527.1 phosphoribosylformylglycinamidine synthase subunit PurQ [candidate division KSB1 bacterium]